MVVKNKIEGHKEHLLFDIDGTLVYFNDLSGLTKEAFLELGYEILDFEKGHIAGVKTLLEKSIVDRNYFSIENHAKEQQNIFGMSKEDALCLVKKLLELSPKYIRGFPFVSETIQELKRDSFCVSDWFLEAQKSKLKEAGIEHLFRIIYTCEGSYAKPNAKRFEEIIKLEKLNPQDCVMIGDSYSDLAASKAGIQTILIDYDGNNSHLYKDSDAVITDFRDLSKILRR